MYRGRFDRSGFLIVVFYVILEGIDRFAFSPFWSMTKPEGACRSVQSLAEYHVAMAMWCAATTWKGGSISALGCEADNVELWTGIAESADYYK